MNLCLRAVPIPLFLLGTQKEMPAMDVEVVHTVLLLRLCLRMEQLGYHWTDLYENPHLSMGRCATSRKVAGSIPDSVSGIFH